jgi:phosphoribosylformylglycinamidine synthase
MPDAAQATAQAGKTVTRIEVWPAPGALDPTGHHLLREARQKLGAVAKVHVGRVYLIESALDDAALKQVATELLADPVNERVVHGASDDHPTTPAVEVHPKPGVMDPEALSTEAAIAEMLPEVSREAIAVSTGHRYQFDLEPTDTPPEATTLTRFAERHLANPVIEAIYLSAYWPERFTTGDAYALALEQVAICDLEDDGLERLSREGHLFLSLEEMRAIRDYYRRAGREPTDIELETLAQTWSEHCVHKTLTATVHYTADEGADDTHQLFAGKPGHDVHSDGSVTIHNLLKNTIGAATHKLMETAPHDQWCVSVFEDNAGIVRFDQTHGLCIKVETHNHPSAIEPYGGAATGIGGCIRDIIGTGQAAKPIANTDVFCVADPSHWREADETDHASNRRALPAGILHPKRILQQVVAGVRDYGNRMGIPTVNGSVYFDDQFIGNPLVFAGCAGLIPLDRAFGDVQAGDRIMAIGGRTGRDGIHGATFSSAELTDSHADEFSHAVQIGNPITEKQMLDVILQARDHEDGPLFNAITDCGAGGFSSAIGEMGETVGADVQLDRAPLKYAGLTYTEIWISEAQERMVLSVPSEKVPALRELCAQEDVELSDLGEFGCHDPQTQAPTLILRYGETEVGRLEMPFLHKGLPTPTRTARWQASGPDRSLNQAQPGPAADARAAGAAVEDTLGALLAHPNIASKHWIVRQYDHEVQGASVVKPLTGPMQVGPSDGAVLRPKYESQRGMVLAGGMAPALSEQAAAQGLSAQGDSYWASLAAIDEAVRNAVCVGADPTHIALLDNFCWPGCDDAYQLGALVRAAEACHDGALAYAAPFVSGKDSLNNQFTSDKGEVIRIPQTLLITAMGLIEDIHHAMTMHAKQSGNVLLLVGQTGSAMGGSHYAMLRPDDQTIDRAIPRVDLNQMPRHAASVAGLIQQGVVQSAHDSSDGGLLVAVAEMAFSGALGVDVDLSAVPGDASLDATARAFAETPGRYVLEVAPDQADRVMDQLSTDGVPCARLGTLNDTGLFRVKDESGHTMMEAAVDELRRHWQTTLDW